MLTFLTSSFLQTGFYFIFHFNYRFSSILITDEYILKPWTDIPGIKSRFVQPQGVKSIRILKTCFPRQLQGTISQISELLLVCNFYGSDINRELLETQLTILKMHAQESSIASVSSKINFLNATICLACEQQTHFLSSLLSRPPEIRLLFAGYHLLYSVRLQQFRN